MIIVLACGGLTESTTSQRRLVGAWLDEIRNRCRVMAQVPGLGSHLKHRALEAKVLDSRRTWWTAWTGAAVLSAFFVLLGLVVVVAPWG